MQVVWQILKSSLNFMLTEKPRLSHVNFASVLVLFACIVYVDFLNDKWTMSSVTCLLSPVSFLLPKTTWLPRLSLGTFASTSLLAVSMFFCMSCQFILAKCIGCQVWWSWWWWWWWLIKCWCHFHCVRVFPANLLRLKPSPLLASDIRHFLQAFYVVSDGVSSEEWFAMIAAT